MMNTFRPLAYSIYDVFYRGQTPEGVTASANQEITNTSISQEGDETTLVFTRPLAPTDTSKTVLSSEDGEEAIFIWGAGSGNTLAYHANSGNVAVADLFCADSSSETEDDDSETMEEAEFDVEVATGLVLSWNASEDDLTVSVKVKKGRLRATYSISQSDQTRSFSSQSVQ